MTTTTGHRVRARRAYDPPDPSGGTRILVDRLWPRGLSKAKAAIDVWEKEIAPSDELRKWYGHDPQRYEEFRRRYRDELREPEAAEALHRVRALVAQGTVTLITAARDIDQSQIPVLLPMVRAGARGRPRGSEGSTGS